MKKLRTLLNSDKFHQLWFFGALLVFVIAGGGLLSRNIWQRRKLIKDMTKTISALDAKAAALEDAAVTLERVDKYARFLEEELVSELDMPSYMVDVALAGSKAGYTVSRFFPRKNANTSEYELSLGFTGYRDPVQLVRSLEALPRITRVESLHLSFSNDLIMLKMQVTILSGNGQ